MQKLPLGEQHFSAIRSEGKLYVDKTERIFQLVNNGKFNFLSRPRRFGKSLLISTLEHLFKGNRQYFDELWIADKWDWEQSFPVIHISFNAIGVFSLGLEKAIETTLVETADKYEILLEKEGIDKRFQELIEKLSKDKKVVLLIDEYDKPIVDYLDDLPKAKENRAILKSFYSILKNTGDHIRFMLITGVSKFSKVSIFSDLNNLDDLTLHPGFADLCGISQKELEHNFEPWVLKFMEKEGISKQEALEKIRYWYNGYGWGTDEKLYNPFSLLGFFNRLVFQNFWFSTGTPTFLIKMLSREFAFRLEDVETSNAILESYDLENMDWRSLLFQTGYLTIKSKTEFNSYMLGYPNFEVKDSLQQFMIGGFSHALAGDAIPKIGRIQRAFLKDDLKTVFETINSFFANIPEPLFIAKTEKYYHSLIHLIFSLLSHYIGSEIHTSRGRLDAAVETPEQVYIFEFKLDKPPTVAINQIKKKGYAEKFLSSGKKILAIGAQLSSEQRGVIKWEKTEIKSELRS